MANINATIQVGTLPANNNDINLAVGGLCRQFLLFKDSVAACQAMLASLTLQTPPYTFDSTSEANIKSAISGLNTALQAIDVTFVNRVAGRMS